MKGVIHLYLSGCKGVPRMKYIYLQAELSLVGARLLHDNIIANTNIIVVVITIELHLLSRSWHPCCSLTCCSFHFNLLKILGENYVC